MRPSCVSDTTPQFGKSPRLRSSLADTGRLWRWGIATVMALSLVEFSQTASAQQKKGPSEDRTLTTKDNVEIKITYFKTNAGPDTPVVILLHGKGGSRQVWKSFAEILQANEFAVITVDLRQHGESLTGGGASSSAKKATSPTLKPADYVSMVNFDLEAVKKFLFEEHQKKQLNMNKLGIVGADMSAAVAMAYTQLDWFKEPYNDAPIDAQKTPRGQDVQALILLSPDGSVPGVPASKAAQVLRELKRPVMIAVGKKVPADVSNAKKIHDQLDTKKDDKKDSIIVLEEYDVKLSGTDLLGKGTKLEQHMGVFLTNHVKKHESQWRDRQSRLDK